MAAERKASGDAAEAAARQHLRQAGLQDVATNARYRFGELDLVMLDAHARGGASLVFVEVRHRATAVYGGGAMSVDARKRRKLIQAAHAFLLAHPQYAQMPCRFDVVDSQGDATAPRLQWLKDAFRADDI